MIIAPSALRLGLRCAACAASLAVAIGCQSQQPAAAPDGESSELQASSTVTAEPAAPAAPTPEEAAQRAAQDASQTWLALVDAGQFEASWDAAAALFKSSVTKEQWNSSLKGAREPLGATSSRKLQGAEYKTQLPGAPDGKYVVVYYDTAFAQKAAAKESVTLMEEPDASWKVAGYFIQ
ncbi:MAG TPA: DUF4019 domain-containing protein [Polyangiaceae bacterium]|nr:DUF4019 domain-containing protein [Polyangiaceae bacterium]